MITKTLFMEAARSRLFLFIRREKKHVCDLSQPNTPLVKCLFTWFQYIPVLGSNGTGISVFGFYPTLFVRIQVYAADAARSMKRVQDLESGTA